MVAILEATNVEEVTKVEVVGLVTTAAVEALRVSTALTEELVELHRWWEVEAVELPNRLMNVSKKSKRENGVPLPRRSPWWTRWRWRTRSVKKRIKNMKKIDGNVPEN
jgi:hypothetical protein